jgi:saccharopine dehydrogenase-like NADP-dependent oxidoreductase
MFALARGTRDGKLASVGATVLGMPSGGMGGATGVPMAVALSMFASGKIDRRGACAPESVIDPDPFFDALAPLCTPPLADGQAMVLISKSD